MSANALQDLLDKQAISEAVMRYCRGVDRLDADIIASAYHPDAYDDHSGKEYSGADVGPGIVEWMSQTMRSTHHHIGTQLIELYGDKAASEAYSLGNHVLKDGRRLKTTVRYLDRFEKREGEWKIIRRLVVNETTESLPAPDMTGFPEIPPLHRRDKTDPSYEFFRP